MSSSHPFPFWLTRVINPDVPPVYFIKSFVYCNSTFQHGCSMWPSALKMNDCLVCLANAGANDISYNAHVMYPTVEFTDWYLFPRAEISSAWADEGAGNWEKPSTLANSRPSHYCRVCDEGSLGKLLLKNQDDNLKPRSMLNKYRHAVDPLSALMLGRSHTRY